MKKKVCAACGKTFDMKGKKARTRCCSTECSILARVKPRNAVCKTCGVEFRAAPSAVKRGQGIYCSKSCYGIAINKRESRVCSFCGEEFHVARCSDKFRAGRFCSRDCYTKSRDNGIVHGVQKFRNCDKYRKWRTSVYARDDYTCQKCGERGGDLNAHHVFPFAQYPEHAAAVWNGTTLCKECHMNMHFKTRSAA